MDRNLSIVTNFGCSYNCPTCINRYHPELKFVRTRLKSVNWQKLERVIRVSKGDSITLTGTDPFFDWENAETLDFYEKISELSNKYKKKLKAVTNFIPMNANLLQKFDEIILRVRYDNFDESVRALRKGYWWINAVTNIGFIQRVDKKIRDSNIFTIINEAAKIHVKSLTLQEDFCDDIAAINYGMLKRLFDILPIDTPINIKWEDNEDTDIYYFLNTNEASPYYFKNQYSREVYKKIYKENLEKDGRQ